MKPLQFLFLFCALLVSTLGLAQKHTISGYVKEADTGESLFGATVAVVELGKGTVTNDYGFYSLTLPEGTYVLSITFVGLEPVQQQVTLTKDLELNFELQTKAIIAKEVTIEAAQKDNTESTSMGRISLDVEKAKTLPALLGEVDVLKTIQLMPGVQSGGEGNSGFYVRGGGPDQNLILLDEAVVYNASHLFGFFSVFNADAVKNIDLHKGTMPAQYGGRLASVLDISMKEGNSKKLQVDGGIGLIASRLTVQGPIAKNRASFIVAGRRTYADVLAEPFIPKTSNFKGSGYFFYDLNTKVNYRINDKNRLFLSGYFGRDVFSYNNTNNGFGVQVPWGNSTLSTRWNHLFSKKLFINATAIYSDFKFEFLGTQSDFEFKLFSGIRDWTGKVDFSYFPSPRHRVKFGLQYINHTFTPSNFTAAEGDDAIFDLGETIKYHAHDAAVYVQDEFDITDELRVNAGLRLSGFQHVGPFNRFTPNQAGTGRDTTSYRTGEPVATYSGLEPRLSVRYKLSGQSSLKAAFTRNLQYIHLASLSTVSLPTDIWVPSSDVVKPQIGVQYSLGYFRNFLKDKYESSVEVYYKEMQNQIEYAEGALPEQNFIDNPDNQFTFGSGTSYGLELFLKRRVGKINGWIGYTWSKTTRTFPEINNGNPFPARFDRRHDLSVVGVYEFNQRWTFAATFVYATGNAITLPVSRYSIEGRIINDYGPRNSFRMRPYHRADISATLKPKPEKKRNYESCWVFAIYNLYSRANPYFIYFDNEGDLSDGTLEITARQVSLFPILPSVAWNFSF